MSPVDIEQRSEAWIQARLGKVTASRIGDVCARTNKGWAARRSAYLHDMIVERLTGVHIPGGSGAARRWGEEVEPEAKSAYAFYRDATIVEVGYVPHPVIADTGASPDGLIGEDGLVEFKCPTVSVHLETLSGSELDPDYFLQMQWQMACTGRAWCDYASYDPRFPESMRLFVDRVQRDDIAIAAIEKDVVQFLTELRETVRQLRAKYEPGQDEPIPEIVQMLMAG